MKDYIYFFIMFTLLEITVSAVYFLMANKVDLTLLVGALIYACGMLSAYLAYRNELYQKRRKELIDSLP
jgi:hypothetical protein